MSISAEQFGHVRDLVYRRAGIVLEDGKEYLVETRLSTLARTLGFEDASAVIDQAMASPGDSIVGEIIDAMTTNETSWFRDIHPFTTLQNELLPRLIGERQDTRELRIFCAAASTGQEPYSLALMLKHHFPQLTGWNVEIVGTDLSNHALEKARTASYSQLEINRGLPATYLRYFEQDGRKFVLEPPVRELVSLRTMNLVEPWPALGMFDLVLIRNVLIYFDVETKRQVLDSVHRVLRPDGVLLLGASETTLNVHPGYQPVRVGTTTVYEPLVGASRAVG